MVNVRRSLFASAPFAIDSLRDPLRLGPDDEDAVADRQPALAEIRFASHVPVGPPPLRVDDLDPFKLGREIARRLTDKDVHAGALRRVLRRRFPDVLGYRLTLEVVGADDDDVAVDRQRLPEERLLADEGEIVKRVGGEPRDVSPRGRQVVRDVAGEHVHRAPVFPARLVVVALGVCAGLRHDDGVPSTATA